MPEYKSKNYQASITIDSLTKDVLLFQSMIGTDELSKPYVYKVEMVRNPGQTIDISKLVGKKACITLKGRHNKGSDRYFHGYVANISYSGASGRSLETFHALVVPWFWFLKKSSKCRIFKGLRVDQVLSAIFKSAKFATGHYKIDLENKTRLPPLEHCVQYQESDFAFASRLMEEFGISYYFTHKKSKHQMVLFNAPGKRPKPPNSDFKKMKYSEARASEDDDAITRWQSKYQVVTDSFTQTDYNFANVKGFPAIITSGQKSAEDQGGLKKDSFEQYIHDGIFIDDGVSQPDNEKNIKEFEDLAKVRLGALQHGRELIYFETDCRGVHSGCEFKLEEHEANARHNNQKFFILSVNHRIELGDYGAGSRDAGKKYTCTATAIPSDVDYYPPRLTPKARIFGPQTAVVVGDDKKKEKLVYTDSLGRVKVKFHWDRLDDRDEIDENADKKAKVEDSPQNQSCWVRVSQGWAGNGWGSFFLPRVGQEVIVEFLDGDPDRPIIKGALYNGTKLTPYKLKDKNQKKCHDTMSVIKSETVGKDGKAAKDDKITNNIIRFQDKEEEEQIFIQAGRSMDKQVLGDHREYVGCNLQITIDGDSKNKDKSDDDSIGHRDVVIKEGNDQLSVKESLIQVVGGGCLLDIKNHASINVGGFVGIQVTDKIVIESDDSIDIKSGGSIVVEAKESISFKAGEDMTLDAGGAINLKSDDEILMAGKSGVGLKGGSSTIELSSDAGIEGGSVVMGSAVEIMMGAPKKPGKPASALKAARVAHTYYRPAMPVPAL